ncbi:Single-strand selective monofunctional uracil DNA glycosylase [Sergentomyia squamirostris]
MLRKKVKKTHSGIEESPTTEDILPESVKSVEKEIGGVVVSKFFKQPLWLQLYEVENRMNEELRKLKFSKPVAAVYNPVEYAADLHVQYMKKFLTERKHILFIGMNPGPWGMCQTGVPFGYIPAVRDWMKLEGEVQKPEGELSVRPIEGLKCSRAEQSGQRFWGLFESLCGEPEVFFVNSFVYNLCPLAFFHASGKNITPAELKGEEKRKLQEICSKSLAEAINLLEPKIIVSIGRYVEDRVKDLLKSKAIDVGIDHKCLPHPSPRSLNNTNWDEKARKWFIDNEIHHFLVKSP